MITSVLIQHLRVYSDYHPFHICNPLWYWETWFLLASLLFTYLISNSCVYSIFPFHCPLLFRCILPLSGLCYPCQTVPHGHTLTLLRLGLSTLDWPLWDAVFTWYQVGSDSHASSTFLSCFLPPCLPSATSRVRYTMISIQLWIRKGR